MLAITRTLEVFAAGVIILGAIGLIIISWLMVAAIIPIATLLAICGRGRINVITGPTQEQYNVR